MRIKIFKRFKRQKSYNTGYCKKCGCELVSSSKRKLCDNCRREQMGIIRRIVEGVGGFVASFVLIFGISKNKK